MNVKQESCVTERPQSESESDPTIEHRASGAAVNRANPERSLELALAAAKTAAENGGTDLLSWTCLHTQQFLITS